MHNTCQGAASAKHRIPRSPLNSTHHPPNSSYVTMYQTLLRNKSSQFTHWTEDSQAEKFPLSSHVSPPQSKMMTKYDC